MSAQHAGPPRQLASERVVVSAPMSFAGSAARLWKMAKHPQGDSAGAAAGRLAMGTIAVFLIMMMWMIVLGWYAVFGLLLVPYRLVRRGSRKRRKQELQHREILEGLARGKAH